jgi:AcrR family transcriptional regulator
MRQARREEILEAASKLFSRQGYHATSISGVIEASGISRGTFYLYFDGKQALFLDLIERFIQRIVAVVRVVDPRGPDPTKEIYANVRRVVDVVFDNRDLAVMVLREDLGLRPDVDETLGRLYAFLVEMVEGALVNGARTGLTRSVDTRIVAPALIGAIKETFYHLLVVENGGAPNRERVARHLVDFCLRGLMPEAGERSKRTSTKSRRRP